MDGIKTCLHDWLRFSGRLRRDHYAWMVLFTVCYTIAVRLLDTILSRSDDAFTLIVIGLFIMATGIYLAIATLSAGVRRLHDAGYSGWWMLITIVPILNLAIIALIFLKSQPGANKYGESPYGTAFSEAAP